MKNHLCAPFIFSPSNKITKSSNVVIVIPKIHIIFVCLSFNIEKKIIIGILKAPYRMCLIVNDVKEYLNFLLDVGLMPLLKIFQTSLI